ncbi:MAG: aspartate kinase [Clostridia bacterium]
MIVQKFGGTSVAEPASRERILQKVAAARAAGDKPLLVVSAMGRRGASYATDTLLDMVPDAAPATRDLIVSCGEVISACLLSAMLESRGIPSRPFTAYTAGLQAEGPYGDASPTGLDGEALRQSLDAGVVPVVTGFQGVLPDGSLATLGRGGSDTTGVALGAYLGADYVDIYTDVPGVAMADPRIIPEAPFLPYLDYRSMVRLAAHGARVLHDRSAVIAEERQVSVRVRSTFDDGAGTVIGPERADSPTPDFLGIAVAKPGNGQARVVAVCRTGKGGLFSQAILAAANRSPETQPDSDALAFMCTEAEAPELARTLFRAANAILAGTAPGR